MNSLYLHVPFCKSKCDYCSFYSITSDYKEYCIASLIRFVKYYGGKKLKTLYIGGGTPSCLEDAQLSRLLESVRDAYDFFDDAEITVEANPESVSDGFLSVLKTHGVNRISIGVQSLNGKELSAIGRIHSENDVYRAIEKIRTHGFDNISCDLIFGLPGQTVGDFERNVLKLKELEIPHLSCYNLQVEKGTAMYGRDVPDEEVQAQMYERLCTLLSDYRHYEISNFCKEGYHSRHNSGYWTGEDYLGLGPAAHSKIGDMRCSFDADIEKFINKTDFEFDSCERITDAVFEKIMLGLRTDRGVSLSVLKNSESFIKTLISAGLATTDSEVLRLTDKGYYLSNTIIAEITAREC